MIGAAAVNGILSLWFVVGDMVVGTAGTNTSMGVVAIVAVATRMIAVAAIASPLMSDGDVRMVAIGCWAVGSMIWSSCGLWLLH